MLKNKEDIGLADHQNQSTNSEPETPIDLDYVLVNELGQFGKFQLFNLLILTIPMIMSGFLAEYIIITAAVPHRCRISECGEFTKDVPYENDWLSNAIPTSSTGLASCERFIPIGGNGTLDNCPINLFSQESTTKCDGFVYARTNTVIYEFDLGCQEWMRVLAGTLNSVGTLLVLPISGFISDRYGRRNALALSAVCVGIFGLIRAFSFNYPMYLAMQLLATTFGGGAFTSGYILATELVGAKYRVIIGTTCSTMFALGQVILGCIAWALQPWRYLLIAISVPCLLTVAYFWIITESIRWLLSKHKYDEAKIVLQKVSRVNNKQISEKSLQALMNPPPPPITDFKEQGSLITSIFKSPILRRRVLTTPIWWISATLVYYGLSINSTNLSDSVYLNYILTVAVEIPGFYTGVIFLDWIGRRTTLSFGYLLSAACSITFIFVSKDLTVVRLVVYLLGKFGISLVITSLYLYTSELYPTQYRQSLLAFSSMIGRFGSILAPLTPALMEYWSGIPSTMFAIMAMISGVLVLTQPETLGTKLPDTLAEAEALGRTRRVVTTKC